MRSRAPTTATLVVGMVLVVLVATAAATTVQETRLLHRVRSGTHTAASAHRAWVAAGGPLQVDLSEKALAGGKARRAAAAAAEADSSGGGGDEDAGAVEMDLVPTAPAALGAVVDPLEAELCWSLAKNCAYWPEGKAFSGPRDGGKKNSRFVAGAEVGFGSRLGTPGKNFNVLAVVSVAELKKAAVNAGVPVAVMQVYRDTAHNRAFVVFRGANTEGWTVPAFSKVWVDNIFSMYRPDHADFVPMAAGADRNPQDPEGPIDYGTVVRGAYAYYDSLRVLGGDAGGLRAVVTDLVRTSPPGLRIVVTGFSMGATLAQLAAVDIAALVRLDAALAATGARVEGLYFAGTRAGNDVFARVGERFLHNTVRIVGVRDPVPTLPPYRAGFRTMGPGLLLDTEGAMTPLSYTQSGYYATDDLGTFDLLTFFAKYHRAGYYDGIFERWMAQTHGDLFRVQALPRAPTTAAGRSEPASEEALAAGQAAADAALAGGMGGNAALAAGGWVTTPVVFSSVRPEQIVAGRPGPGEVAVNVGAGNVAAAYALLSGAIRPPATAGAASAGRWAGLAVVYAGEPSSGGRPVGVAVDAYRLGLLLAEVAGDADSEWDGVRPDAVAPGGAANPFAGMCNGVDDENSSDAIVYAALEAGRRGGGYGAYVAAEEACARPPEAGANAGGAFPVTLRRALDVAFGNLPPEVRDGLVIYVS